MSDKPVEQRLSDVADRLKATLLVLPAFRPDSATNKAGAEAFDAMVSDLVDTLVEIAQAAAIDERALILAKDMSMMRQDMMLRTQQEYDKHSTDMATIAAELVKLPFQTRATA